MLLEQTGAVINRAIHQSDIFVKIEAYIGKCWRAWKPRIIQCRHPDLQLLLGAFFYSVSKWLGTVFSYDTPFVYDSGLDAVLLGSIVMAMFATNGLVIESDVSSWDGSIHKIMKKLEIWFVENCVPRLPWFWEHVKPHWVLVFGSSKGVTFMTWFCRRSGDMWTACFNTLLNILVTCFVVMMGWWDPNFVEESGFKMVAKGDDNMFTIMADYVDLSGWISAYAELGMTVKIYARYSYQTLEYCSGKFYAIDNGLKWGVKPFRVLAKFGLNLKNHRRAVHKRLLLGTALGMMPIAGHVPILGDMFRAIVIDGHKKGVKALYEDVWEGKISSTTVHWVTNMAIDDFCTHYGFSYPEYLRLHQWASTVTLDSFPCVLEDELFTRGYLRDCDLEVCPELIGKDGDWWFTTEQESSSKYEFLGWYFWILEEVFYWILLSLFPQYVLVVRLIHGFWETWSYWFYEGKLVLNIIAHVAFQFLMTRYGLPFSLIAHCVYNLVGSANLILCGRRKRLHRYGYGPSLLDGNNGDRYRFRWKSPGVFTLIPNCLGLLKYSIIGFSKIRRDLGRCLFGSKYKTGKNHMSKGSAPKKGPKPTKKKICLHGCAVGCFNPFLSSCIGCKIPDAFAMPTTAMVSRGAISLSNNGVYTSGAVLAFGPTPSSAILQANAITAPGVVTWTGGTPIAVNGFSNWAGQVNSYRLVCGGLRLSCEQAITSATGHVVITHAPLNYNADLTGYSCLPTTESIMLAADQTIRFPIAELAEKPVIVPFRRTDHQSFDFHSLNYPEGKEDIDPGWAAPVIYTVGCAGGAGAVVLSIEYIFHWEIIINRNSASSLLGFESMPEPFDPTAIAQMSLAGQAAPPASASGDDKTDGDWMASIFKTIKSYADMLTSPEVINTATSIYQVGSRIASAFPLFF
jgi:hypothetical protein